MMTSFDKMKNGALDKIDCTGSIDLIWLRWSLIKNVSISIKERTKMYVQT